MKSINDYINKNKHILQKSLEIDNETWNENLKFEEVLNCSGLENLVLEKHKTYLVIYDGEPIHTKIIINKALEVDANIIFILDDYFLATNSFLTQVTNKLIKENNKKIFIKLYNNIYEEKIFKSTSEVDTTIYIGDERNFEYIQNNVKNNLIKIKY